MGEDSVSNHSDDVNDANEEDNSDEEEDDDHYWANSMQDIPCYDSDGHLIIEDFVPSDQVDEVVEVVE